MRGLLMMVLVVVGVAVAVLMRGEAAPDGAAATPRTGEASGDAAPLPPPPTGSPADEAEVLAVVQALFDAMRARDSLAMADLFHDQARLMSAMVQEDGVEMVRETPIGAFVRSVGRAENHLDERTAGEEVRVDGPLATAWTPYAFHVDGEFSHCGVNAFQLVRTDGAWKILQITDTRRQDACPEGAPI